MESAPSARGLTRFSVSCGPYLGPSFPLYRRSAGSGLKIACILFILSFDFKSTRNAFGPIMASSHKCGRVMKTILQLVSSAHFRKVTKNSAHSGHSSRPSNTKNDPFSCSRYIRISISRTVQRRIFGLGIHLSSLNKPDR